MIATNVTVTTVCLRWGLRLNYNHLVGNVDKMLAHVATTLLAKNLDLRLGHMSADLLLLNCLAISMTHAAINLTNIMVIF